MSYVANSWMQPNFKGAVENDPVPPPSNLGQGGTFTTTPGTGDSTTGGNRGAFVEPSVGGNRGAFVEPRVGGWGNPNPYASQFQRYIGMGGNREDYVNTLGAQRQRTRPNGLMRGTPLAARQPGPVQNPLTPFPDGPPVVVGGEDDKKPLDTGPSVDQYMRQPPWVRPQFGGP